MTDEEKPREDLILELRQLRQQLGASRRVTEEAAAERERTGSYIDSILNQSPNVIFVKDLNLTYVVINDRFLATTGCSREEVLGADDFKIFTEEEARVFKETDERVLKTGTTETLESTYLNPDGTMLDYIYAKFVVRDHAGEALGIGCIATDITDRKRAEEGLCEAQKRLLRSQKMEALGTLAGGIAHDFNNILTVIQANSELIGMNIPEGSDDIDSVQDILKATQRATSLIRRILTFSHVNVAGLKRVDPRVVVEEALHMVRAVLPANVEIRREIEHGDGHIMADESQIHEIVLNLCTNAYHAMQESGGVLEVRLDESDGGRVEGGKLARRLTLTVRDTGCGIAAENLEKIFDPFFSTKEVSEGTGLGLAVVHGIVRSHGGTIEVESELEAGTLFRLSFPLVERVLELPTSVEAPVSEGQGHLLVVEDEDAIRRSYQKFFEGWGYEVVACANGLEALTLFEQDPDRFDVVLSDQAMPGMTGKQLSQILLTIRPNLPIILLTGYSDTMSADEALAMGIRQFLMKPVSLRKLQQAISDVLR
jgi:PAS domain S-box-containing protein